jgi:hypothetical protein
MNKGCIIALVVTFILVAIAVSIAIVKGYPWYQKIGSAGIVYTVELAIDEYTEKYENPPPGNNHVEVIKSITGDNPDRRDFFPPKASPLIKQNKIYDLYGGALIIERTDDSSIRVFSSGKDGIPGNEDDISSDDISETEREEVRRQLMAE